MLPRLLSQQFRGTFADIAFAVLGKDEPARTWMLVVRYEIKIRIGGLVHFQMIADPLSFALRRTLLVVLLTCGTGVADDRCLVAGTGHLQQSVMIVHSIGNERDVSFTALWINRSVRKRQLR